MSFDWHTIWDYRADLLSGLLLTVKISGLAIIGATVVGVTIGCLRTLPSFFINRLCGLYIQAMRNIPATVKLFFAYFVIGMGDFTSGLLVLILHQGAYIADVTSSGLRSVAIGQQEAARATALSEWQIFRYVLLPQALRAMLPPLTTQYIQTVKNSSIVMLVSLQDLTFMTQRISIVTYRSVEAATTVTLLYLILVLCVVAAMAALQRILNRRFAWT